jgi:dTDP-4-dehydrorhamnose reductase
VNILILGGDGMLGHQLRRTLSESHRVQVTLRQALAAYERFGIPTDGVIDGIDVLEPGHLERALDLSSPQVVINCIGVVKQRPDGQSPVPSILINALLPHRLNELCAARGVRLIHFSTDCVFSGRLGGYRETDLPDPVDVYGRSKLLGEVERAPGLTLRTSIVGLELSRKTSLVEWFLAQRGVIRGYRRAIYSGLTTREMGRLVSRLIDRHPQLHGIWHVASAPINKYDLLVQFAQALGRRDIIIEPDEQFVCDRSLRSDAFGAATGYAPPSWSAMLEELARDVEARERTQARIS